MVVSDDDYSTKLYTSIGVWVRSQRNANIYIFFNTKFMWGGVTNALVIEKEEKRFAL